MVQEEISHIELINKTTRGVQRTIFKTSTTATNEFSELTANLVKDNNNIQQQLQLPQENYKLMIQMQQQMQQQ